MLLLDEPYAGVDPASAERIAAVFAELRSEGRTLLISTHDVESARSFDLVLCLNGRQVAFGDPATSLGREVLEATYGGDMVVLEDGGGPGGARHHGAAPRALNAMHVADLILEPLRSGIERRALLEVILLGGVCGALSFWVTSFRLSLPGGVARARIAPGPGACRSRGCASAARRGGGRGGGGRRSWQPPGAIRASEPTRPPPWWSPELRARRPAGARPRRAATARGAALWRSPRRDERGPGRRRQH